MFNYLYILIIGLTFNSCSWNSIPDNSDVKNIARLAILNNVLDVKGSNFHHNEEIVKINDSLYIYTETITTNNQYGAYIANNVRLELKWNGNNPSNNTSWTYSKLQFTPRNNPF
jgi:hypothetical protein